MSTLKTEFAILGAGPTGLGAAWRLHELGHSNWRLVEASDHVGGLASSTVDDKGFLWDMGGHVLFSHYQYFDQVLDNCMGDNWLNHKREAWVWIRNSFIPYPLQNNVWRLPEPDLIRCIDGLLSVHNKVVPPLKNETFEDWLYRSFGKGLAEIFFLPYNFKVWAYEPKHLSSCWIQERVATVKLENILRNLILRLDDFAWGPNASFRFPARGGTGMIWTRVAENLPDRNKLFESKVVQIDPDAHMLKFSNGATLEYQHLVTGMPLDQLLKALEGKPRLSSQSKHFRHSSVNLVGIGVEGNPPQELQKKCWVYFVEDDFPFYRVTVFSNYSQFNVPRPGEQYSLLCEVSESKDKPVDHTGLSSSVLEALKRIGFISSNATIASVWQKRLEYGYPTPFLSRDQILPPIDEELRNLNIFSRGRFGAWKYEVSNQDHSFMQGVEAIDHILSGAEEVTYNHPNMVNAKSKPVAKP